MRPVCISKTIQEFDGERYYRCGFYFQKRGKRLHRVVWEANNGPIPEGAHIHHIDGDRANNQPENLECLTVSEHLGGEHGKESGKRGKRSIVKAGMAARRWHGTAAGRAWHSEHYERHIRPVMEQRIPAKCHECGGEYMVSAARAKQGKFCSGACKARALRKRRRRG